MKSFKNNAIFLIYAILIGSITSLIVWGFLRLNSLGVQFLWEFLPSVWQISVYAIIVCTIGGLLIGLWKKKFGDYPENLETVLTSVKKKGALQV